MKHTCTVAVATCTSKNCCVPDSKTDSRLCSSFSLCCWIIHVLRRMEMNSA